MSTRVPGHHAPASPSPRDRPHGPGELTVGSALLAFRAGGTAPDDDGGGSLGGAIPVDGGAALDGGGAASADGGAGVDAAGAVPDDIVDLCDDSPALSTGAGATIDLCDSSPSPPAPTRRSNGRDREKTEGPSSNSPPSPDSSSHGDESDKDFVPAGSSPRSDSSPPATPLPPTPAKDFFETEVRVPRAAPSPPSPLDTGEPSTYAESLASLARTHQRGCTWHSGPIFISVAVSLADNAQRTINLTPTLGHKKHPPKAPDDLNSYFLPAELNQNNEHFRKT